MRIPLSKVWRAFPELDRFTDEQCKRFVRAACKRDWRRHVHRGGLGCLTLVFFVVLFWVTMNIDTRFDSWLYPRRFARDLATFAGLVLSLGIPAAVAIVARDRLLLRRIRFVLSARGSCPACRYSLLGIVVSSGNLVTCPECGMEVEVDESLSELTTDEQGRELFTPSERVEGISFWTPSRRRFFKRAVIGLAVLVFVVLPAMWGLYELFLWRQAKTARAERPGVEGVLAFIEDHQPSGTTVQDANAWDAYAQAEALYASLSEQILSRPPYTTEEDVFPVWPDYSAMYAEYPPSEDPDDRATAARNLRYAEELFAACREEGVFELLDTMADAPRAVRPLVVAGTGPLVVEAYPELSRVREYARLNAARMHRALEAGDRQEFLAAFETMLALARATEHQGSTLNTLVALAVEAFALDRAGHAFAQHPDVAWLSGIESAIARQRTALPRGFAFRGEAVFQLDAVAWCFSDPSRTRLGRFSAAFVNSGLLGWGVPLKGGLGTYAGNREAIESYTEAMVKAVELDPFERPALPPAPDRLLLNMLLPAYDRMMAMLDEREARRRGMRMMLALERHSLAHGAYPERLEALVPEFLAELPVDPWTGEPLRYRLTPGEGIGYVLYSVGSDGVDDGGEATEHKNGRTMLNPDLILSPKGE